MLSYRCTCVCVCQGVTGEKTKGETEGGKDE